MYLPGVLLACRAMIYSGRSLHRVPSRWWSRCFRSDCQYENFSFFKKGLAVDYSYDYFCEVVLVSILSLLRVSVNIPRPFSPHIYHLKEQRVKKKKKQSLFFFFFFCLFDFFLFSFFPIRHSLSAFSPLCSTGKIHQASACHSFIDYCLATYFRPVASDTLCPLLSPLPPRRLLQPLPRPPS